jgi:hypothetical protein
VAAARAASADGERCRLASWPVGVVTDDAGTPVAAQWLATPENTAAARDVQDRLRANDAPSGHYGYSLGGRALRPIVSSGSGAPADWTADKTRYELVFLADVPAHGLATYFVTAAWQVTASKGSGGGSGGAPASAPCGVVPALLDGIAALPAPAVVMVSGVSGPQGAAPDDASDGSAALNQRLVAAAVTAPEPDADTAAESVVIENACLALEVSASTGLISAITYKHARGTMGASVKLHEPVRVRVKQQFGHYGTSASGAYIFRPQAPPQIWGQGVDVGDATVTVSTAAMPANSGGREQRWRNGGVMQARGVCCEVLANPQVACVCVCVCVCADGSRGRTSLLPSYTFSGHARLVCWAHR